MSAINLSYPMGLGESLQNHHHYMMVESFESKTALHKGKKISSIALYIPPNSLTTTLSANYEGLAGGATKALTGSRLGGSFIQNIGDTLAASFTGMADVSGKLISKAPIGKDMMAAGAGMAVNNHMALVYKGPGEFRTHDFSFNFFPKHEDDSKVIKDILQDLKDGMFPKMSGTPLRKNRAVSAPFFMAPRHWTIDFFKGDGTENTYLHKIKKSVIKNMQINHDPNSTISFHKDGSPVQTTLTLSFQEIELPFSGDDAPDLQEQIHENMADAISNRTI